MQLTQIEGFLEVARSGNVSRASAQLGITQPALTARLQALEEEVGQPLFVRGRRGMRLTDAGRVLLPYAEQAVTALASGLAELSELGAGTGGELAVACSPAASTYVLPHVLVRFAAEHPGVRLVVHTGHSEEIVEMVVRGAVAVGLGRVVRHPLVVSRPVYADELVLVSPPGHPLAQAERVSRAALSGASLIVFDRQSSYFDLTMALVREAGVRPRGVIELDNIEAAKRMVLAGLGVALLPNTSVAEELADGRLSTVRLEDGVGGTRQIVVARRADAGVPTPIVAAFIALLDRIPQLVPGALPPRV